MSYQAERKAWVAEITRRWIEDYESEGKSISVEDVSDLADLADMIAEFAVPDDRSEQVALCARLGLDPAPPPCPSFALIYDAAYEGATALLMAERWERGK